MTFLFYCKAKGFLLTNCSFVRFICSLKNNIPNYVNFASYYNYVFKCLFLQIPHTLSDLSTDQGCFDSHIYDKVNTKNTVVAIARGNCTFSEKAMMAERYRSVAILIVDKSVVREMTLFLSSLSLFANKWQM